MFCAVFSYEVRDPVAFEQMYGPDGEWARFFSRGPGYLGTELLASGEGRYLLIDRWFSRAAYETFLAANHAEYERRSGAGEGLYVREERIGTFESPPTRGLHLRILPGRFAVCRLDPAAALPDAFWSVTRTDDELSVICADDAVPAAARVERGWRGLQVAGPLDLALTGVAAALTVPLAAAAVPVLLVGTYDTDHLFVREASLTRAVAALAAAGHTVGTHS